MPTNYNRPDRKAFEDHLKAHFFDLSEEKFNEMTKSLVCLLDKQMVENILIGEQYDIADIDAFIEKCES